jgi:GTPase SAR1 family protein
VTYDITDRESFKAVDNWMAEVDKYAAESVNRILVGNKVDLEDSREVTFDEGKVIRYKQHCIFKYYLLFRIFFKQKLCITSHDCV